MMAPSVVAERRTAPKVPDRLPERKRRARFESQNCSQELLLASQRKNREAVGVKAPYPDFIEPVLAKQVDRVPRGTRWLHEIKFDGYRAQLHIMNQGIKV
jgi:ATP-dependent DNA ligase